MGPLSLLTGGPVLEARTSTAHKSRTRSKLGGDRSDDDSDIDLDGSSDESDEEDEVSSRVYRWREQTYANRQQSPSGKTSDSLEWMLGTKSFHYGFKWVMKFVFNSWDEVREIVFEAPLGHSLTKPRTKLARKMPKICFPIVLAAQSGGCARSYHQKSIRVPCFISDAWLRNALFSVSISVVFVLLVTEMFRKKYKWRATMPIFPLSTPSVLLA